jgi:EpsI family protein
MVWRGLFLTLLMVLCWQSVSWFRAGISAEGEVPRYSLSQLPKVMGQWSGEDVELADESVQVLGAHDFINRSYFDGTGRRVMLHAAIWLNEGHVSPAPHPPTVCYPAAGWSIMSRGEGQFDFDGEKIPIEIVRFQKDHMGVVTGHWFEVGSAIFTTAEGFFKQRLKIMGTDRWPYTVKFMIQTDATSIEQAEPVLREFSQLVRAAYQELSEESKPDVVEVKS